MTVTQWRLGHTGHRLLKIPARQIEYTPKGNRLNLAFTGLRCRDADLGDVGARVGASD